jgi:AcrR family transcriptional regulator
VLHRKQAPSPGAAAAADSAAPDHPAAGSAKRAAILDAARAVFLEQGFAGASMDAITRRAGVSKATVYAHFPSKLALFEAIVRDGCRATVAGATLCGPAGPREALIGFGVQLLRFLTDPETLALYRVVLAEAARVPELGRTVYAAGPDRGAGELAAFFAAQAAAGRMRVADPRLAAEQFCGMLLGHFHLRRLLAVESGAPPAAAIERAVAQAVDSFLAGVERR